VVLARLEHDRVAFDPRGQTRVALAQVHVARRQLERLAQRARAHRREADVAVRGGPRAQPPLQSQTVIPRQRERIAQHPGRVAGGHAPVGGVERGQGERGAPRAPARGRFRAPRRSPRTAAGSSREGNSAGAGARYRWTGPKCRAHSLPCVRAKATGKSDLPKPLEGRGGAADEEGIGVRLRRPARAPRYGYGTPNACAAVDRAVARHEWLRPDHRLDGAAHAVVARR
jgi:hypothetical protein